MTARQPIRCKVCGLFDPSFYKGRKYCSLTCAALGHVEIGKSDECWSYTGSIDAYGYGCTLFMYGKYKAHRVVYELFKGPLNGMECMHECDNPTCCNPHHLRGGSHAQNMNDMMDKKRNPVVVRKISDDQVRVARKMRAEGMVMREISEFLGVHPSTITHAVCGITWKHITDPPPVR